MLERGFFTWSGKICDVDTEVLCRWTENQTLCLSELKGSNHADDALERTILRQLHRKLRVTLCFHYPD